MTKKFSPLLVPVNSSSIFCCLSSDGLMDGMDNVWMDAMADRTDDLWTLGIFAGILCRWFTTFFSHNYWGNLMGFQLMVMEPDGLTDKCNDVQMERKFPRIWTFEKFSPAILMGTFTMN